MKAMEGKSRAELEEKMRRDYLATMKVNWSVWPLISFINFRFIPPSQRYFPPTAGLLVDLWCMSSCRSAGLHHTTHA
jgi:protein Mpv17